MLRLQICAEDDTKCQSEETKTHEKKEKGSANTKIDEADVRSLANTGLLA